MEYADDTCKYCGEELIRTGSKIYPLTLYPKRWNICSVCRPVVEKRIEDMLIRCPIEAKPLTI